jgi:hypothetical protein
MKVIAAHQLVQAPQRCAVIPYIGPATRDARFIDTGNRHTDGFADHVYISEPAVREMARMLGMPDRGEFRQMRRERDQLAAELEQAREELVEFERVQQAIDVLESKDFRARRKPGRPKQEAAA